MMKREPFKPYDALGQPLMPGDIVRVIGTPDLCGMRPADLRRARAAFAHLVGTYRRIDGFDREGLAEIFFVVRRGALRGIHSVAIEPFLLRRKGTRSKSTNRGKKHP